MIGVILILITLLSISCLCMCLYFEAEIKDLKKALHEAYEARVVREITAMVERQAKELFPCDCVLCKEKEEENETGRTDES